MPDTERDDKARKEREKRLAEALRENLRKRKSQARGRRAGEADSRVGLPASPVIDKQTPETAD
ncbi:hypothetical protein [Oryzibacter oryziterrae]|uniref:hypothetical protein n=1 Tax=Oryzibacter oryziterrae TaxID=2766474 RepID=UPI001F3C64BC|nr:hypothetical protein [Oryzibacter oryziterrae]